MIVPIRLVNKIRALLLPIPVKVLHREYSAIFSAVDEPYGPSARLIEVALESSRLAGGISLRDISSRMKAAPYFPDIWPGEHYRLLAGLVSALKPRVVVEIGTATGLSALALKKFLPEASKIFTFDVIAWGEYPDTCLREEDFADGRLVQYVADLSRPFTASEHSALLKSADIIFIDAAKDGVMENRFIDNFGKVGLKRGALVVFDDIRLWNMLKIWRDIRMPKLDLTSFGHWSGTGLAEWPGEK